MGFVNLKEMSKKLKMTEDEVEEMVEMGIIKPPAYCYPAKFGDGHSIAFRPEQVEEQLRAAKSKPKPEPIVVPEEPEVEPEDTDKGEEEEETAEAPVPETPKAEELAKKKAEEKAMLAAEKKSGKK